MVSIRSPMPFTASGAPMLPYDMREPPATLLRLTRFLPGGETSRRCPASGDGSRSYAARCWSPCPPFSCSFRGARGGPRAVRGTRGARRRADGRGPGGGWTALGREAGYLAVAVGPRQHAKRPLVILGGALVYAWVGQGEDEYLENTGRGESSMPIMGTTQHRRAGGGR
jgi:hypothetical protein